jgi:hypothetical protein
MKIKTEHAETVGQEHPTLPGYRLVKRSRYKSEYQKVNPLTRVGSYIVFDYSDKTMTVGKIEDPAVVQATLRLNKMQQNAGKKRDDLMRPEWRLPATMETQLKNDCGLELHSGLYDEKKFAATLDDPDFKYLKTTSDKISGRLREI